jgi:UDP-2,3-diacylglucosamine pyrophosphatase LpxH
MGKLSDELQHAPTVRQRAAESKRVAQLERIVEEQQATIESLRGKSIRIPLGKKPSGKRPSSFVRAIVGDSHGAHIDADAANAFLADLEELKPSEVVLLGDHLDCGGWLAQHHVLGFVPETAATFEDDVAAANQFLDAVQQRAPGAKVWYIEGNHEHRLVKHIIKMALGNQRDVEYLLRLWGCKAVLNLPARNIEFVRRDELQPGLRVRGAIKLGKCYFTHGTNTGIHATHRTLQQFKANVCHGHTHRICSATVQSAEEQTLGGWSFGCLASMQPLYYDTRTTDWSHGYGIQFVEPDGSFTTWPVPILDGKSRLRMLLNRK